VEEAEPAVAQVAAVVHSPERRAVRHPPVLSRHPP